MHSANFYGGIVQTELVVYPDAHPESTTVDGYARRVGVDETFATIRAGSGNGNLDTGTNTYAAFLVATATANQYSQLLRGIFLFDTSSIPSGATIISATLSLYGTSKSNGLGSPALDVVSSNPASNTATANGNFTTLGTTVYGSVSYASYSTSGYNDISLDVACITKAGITKLGTRLSWDTANSFGGSWSNSANTSFLCYFADNGSNKPKLTVVYTT